MSSAPTPPSVIYPFDRRFWPPDSNPTSGDLNLATQFADETLRAWILNRYGTVRYGQLVGGSPNPAVLSGGFFGAGFMPRASGAFGVTLSAGYGFKAPGTNVTSFEGNYNLNDMNAFRPLVLPSEVTFVCPTAGAQPRIDLIEARPNLATADPADTLILNELAGTISTQSKNRTLTRRLLSSHQGFVLSPASSTAALSYKQGVAGASPTAPSVTSGYEAVAYVYVPGSAGTITAANIYDLRRLVGPMRVSLCVTKDSGTAGALTINSIEAPPGVQVAVYNNTGAAQAGYILYVLCGNANLAHAAGVASLPVQVSTYINHSSPSEAIIPYAWGAVEQLNGTVVTHLAADVLGGVTAGSSLSSYKVFKITVRHMRVYNETFDYAIDNGVTDSLTFDIPVL